MSFNRYTYRANRYAKDAYAGIAKAKDVKARAARGEAYQWEIDRLPLLVSVARGDMHLSLMYRSLKGA